MRVVALGDVHFQWENTAAVRWAIAQVRHYKPHTVIQVGDLYDRRAYSRFFPSRGPEAPGAEDKQSRAKAVEFWERITAAAPRARRVQLWGNHDEFPIKRTWERFPEAEHAVRSWLKRQMTFPGVELAHSYRDVVPLGDGWHATHGYTSDGRHAVLEGKNILCGHLHKASLTFTRCRHWEFNVGWLGNFEAAPFWYTPTKTNQWTLGAGLLEDGDARFLRFQ